MKRVGYLIAITIFCTTICNAQDYFQGKILYEYGGYLTETGKDVSNFVQLRYGKEQHYYINTSNYVSYDENGRFKQLYNSETNVYYYLDADNNIQSFDANEDSEGVSSFIIREETESVLGFDCRIVEITTEFSGKTIYWYSESLKVDTDVYQRHLFGGWTYFLNQTKGALPLKYEIHDEGLVIVLEAKKITEEIYGESFFDIGQIRSAIEKN